MLLSGTGKWEAFLLFSYLYFWSTETYSVGFVWEKVTAVVGDWTHHLYCQPRCGDSHLWQRKHPVHLGQQVPHPRHGPVIVFLGEQI